MVGVYDIDYRSANPFYISRKQAYYALIALPLILSIWFFFLLWFKNEINTMGDERGYHVGGVYLANSLLNGTFFQDLFDKDLFKYPGYYGFAGLVYSIFGESQLLLRAFGILPLLGLAIVVGNVTCLIVGERARSFAMLCVVFSPVFLFFSLQLYRDIYIIFAVAVILHATIAAIQLKLPLRSLLSLPVLLALILLYLLRTPQLYITIALLLLALMVCWGLSFYGIKRKLVLLSVVAVTAVMVFVLRGSLLEIMSQVFFEGEDRVIAITQLNVLSSYAFTNIEEMLSALFDPKFIIITFIAKFTALSLGPHPFVRAGEEQLSVLDLFGVFPYGAWGGYQWVDVFLVYGLQWIPQFLLLPFFIAGLIGLWRYNGKIFVVLFLMWGFYSVLTIFSGNEVRWGLPNLLVYYVITASGFGWYRQQLNQYILLSLGLLTVVVMTRYNIYIPVVALPLLLITLKAWRLSYQALLFLVLVSFVVIVVARVAVPIPVVLVPMFMLLLMAWLLPHPRFNHSAVSVL